MTVIVAQGSQGSNFSIPTPAQYGAVTWNGSAWETDLTGAVDISAEFGVSTSATDNSTAINNALATLGPLGLRLFLKPGTYNIQNPIVIGNGSSTLNSTWSAALIGGGFAPWSGPTHSIATSVAGATLKYTGSAGLNQLVQIAGPIPGWELSNLLLDGGGGATAPTWALQVASGQRGYSHRLNVQGCINGIEDTTVGGTSLPSLSFHNRFEQTSINWVGSSGQNYGLRFDSGSPTYSDPAYEVFHNLDLVAPNTSLGGTRNAVAFQVCDNIRLEGMHLWGASGSDALNGLVFDYSANNQFPNDCYIGLVDFGGSIGITNIGTPGTTAPNRVVAISKGNNQPGNPGLTNLAWGYSNASP